MNENKKKHTLLKLSILGGALALGYVLFFKDRGEAEAE